MAQQCKLKELLAAEREIRIISKIFNILLVFAGIAYTGGPLLLIIFNYFNGTFTPELRVHPFQAMYARIHNNVIYKKKKQFFLSI